MSGRRVRSLVLAVVGLVPCAFAASPADLHKVYAPVVQTAAKKHGVDPDLVHLIIRAESNYDNFAISEKGAMGLMQLMPATAERYGVRNVFDASQNIEGGVRYLKDLIKLFGGETRLVLAAYNAGQEAVKKYKGIPPYAETRAYIETIMRTYKKGRVSTLNPVYMGRDASGRILLTNDPTAVRKLKD